MNKEKLSKVKSIYAEIRGYLRNAPTKNSVLYNLTFKENLDDCVDQLNTLTGKNYDKFKVVIRQSQMTEEYIDLEEYRSKLNGLIDKLHTDYFSAERHPYSGSPGLVINQSQSQTQSQMVDLAVLITKTVAEIEKNYGAEQSEEAKKMLSELQKDNKWATAVKVAKWFLDLGRDAFVAVLPVLTQALINK